VLDGRDDDALLAAIDGWLSSRTRREEAGAAGRRWVVENWSWQVIADRFAALLEEVVAQEGSEA
jgi:phosphatidyl-myo-inositol dimannoside synthase